MMAPMSRAAAGQRILVVDDDPANRGVLVELLADEGFGADAVCDGRQALRWLARPYPDTGLILLDLMMPIMGGDAFLFAKEDDQAIADVPVVLMTASGGEACDRIARDHRVSHFLHKPISVSLLLAALVGLKSGPKRS
jgi:two-component system chemotaxis response regulator CheY